MTQLTGRRRTTFDILVIAWVLSAMLLLVEFTHAAPGFPDVAPQYGPVFWVCLGLFAGLQVATTVVNLSRQKFTIWSLVTICVSLLILYPESILLFFALILYPIVLASGAILALVLSIRLAIRLASKS